MERITKKDLRMAAERLTNNARLCLLLDAREEVLYNAGNASNGIPSVLSVRHSVELTERQAYWLPRFTYKDTARTQYKAIEAANDALRAAHDIISDLQQNAGRL